MVTGWMRRWMERPDGAGRGPDGDLRAPGRTSGRHLAATAFAALAVAALALLARPDAAVAQDKEGQNAGAEAAATAAEPTLNVELNTIEQQEDACRVYLVVKNQSEDRYTDLEMELILFDKDGFVSRRYAVQIAPLQPNKTRVRPFDLPELDCATVGQFLINDVTKCAAEDGEKPDCLKRIRTESKGDVTLFM